jgi:mono/diheme cytochrome c family protein
MRLIFKILLGLGVLVCLMVGVGVYVLQTSFPDVGDAPHVQVEATPERIERGRYLAYHVSMCIDCHSERNWDYFAGPLKEGSEGQGGEVFSEEMGLPGTLIAPNITPAALGDWTDGEVMRAFTSGVNKHGDPLFPIMPYPLYAQMAQEDVYAIVAYLRTLAPIAHIPPRSHLNFPMNLIVRTIPQPYQAPQAPDLSDLVRYGQYLTTIAACGDCHTQNDHGAPLPGMEMAGGFEFPLPTGKVVRSANITPDMETGIGHWNKPYFIAQFKRFDKPEAHTIPAKDGVNTVMPWTMYAGMTESDLGAIYDYLRTIPPVKNGVDKFPE